jgi:hypothetical protein
MIECVFTIDYEIYGNGEGSLRELVYEPAEKLRALFQKWNARFVVFVEVAELQALEAEGTDPAIGLVKDQIRNFSKEGFELGLHLHPQWCNARYEGGKWLLDYSEYNLCTLPRYRIVQIVDRSIAYLRNILASTDFTPFSFRAGNWLFQPTQPAAEVLAERGIKVDSSVFKGGLQHQHKLDYRSALKNCDYWRFYVSANVPDPQGSLIELPIFTQMVPAWRMLTAKRVGLHRKGSPAAQTGKNKLYRMMDLLRVRHPLKFDFCRMTIDELTRMMDMVIREDEKDPTSFRPIVAIGHTKDLVDLETVESFLAYLGEKEIPVSTFKNIYRNCVTVNS